jgi:hypothetical protein
MASMGYAIERYSHRNRNEELHNYGNCQRDSMARMGFFCNSHSDEELYHHARGFTRPNVKRLETMGCPDQHQFDNRLAYHSSCFDLDALGTVDGAKHNDNA